MTDRVCHVCGADARIFDVRGGWCQQHYDEDQAARKHSEREATIAAGGPWPQVCPRRAEVGADPAVHNVPATDTWDIREQFANGLVARHCSWCGSLHPDDLIERLREGYTVSGTDKSYKVYVHSPDGQQVTKFYTPHLTDEHRATLRALLGGGA